MKIKRGERGLQTTRQAIISINLLLIVIALAILFLNYPLLVSFFKSK